MARGESRTLASHHVVYEYANLLSCGELLTRPQSPPPPLNTHVQDGFLLGCRKMADFFLKPPQRNSVSASDYLSDPNTEFHLPVWRKWKKAVNSQLARISYARVKSPQPWDGTTNGPLLDEFRQAWRLLLSKLEAGYRQEFDKQITERRRSPGFRDLDLT